MGRDQIFVNFIECLKICQNVEQFRFKNMYQKESDLIFCDDLVYNQRRNKVALTGFMRYLICRVVLKKLTSSTFVSYYFTILSYISIKFSAHVLS